MTAPGLSIREFLDAPLSRLGAVRELTDAAALVAERPLDEVDDDFRAEIASRPVDVDGQRRLHLLISQLYHLMDGFDSDRVAELRAVVVAAFEEGRTAEEGGDHHVLPGH